VLTHDLPLALSLDDVLLVPQYSDIASRADVTLATHLSKNLELKTPLVTTKMDTITGVVMAQAIDKLGGIGILPRFDMPEDQAKKVREVTKSGCQVLAAVGVKDGFLERARLLIAAGAVGINIDVAHGHMQQTIDAVQKIRQEFGTEITIIAGITATYECARDLYEAGADCLLVGIGAGSICTTRIQTGCGVPTFTSLVETARAAQEYGRTFMPDGGIKHSGDMVKALAAGACAILGGFIFAGSDACPGEIIMVLPRDLRSSSNLRSTRQIKMSTSPDMWKESRD